MPTTNTHGNLPSRLPDSDLDGIEIVELDDASRLDAIRELDILDKPLERNFQMLTGLACQLLGVPVALISLVTDERQFFVSSTGLPDPWASCRETPLTHSFCQHVVKRRDPLVISDARNHPLVCRNLATTEIGVAAYLGSPLIMSDGTVIGSFCAIDINPREWSSGDLETLKKIGDLTVAELSIRQEAEKERLILERRLRESQKMNALGRLVGGVAHDFNNVLGAIQVHADLLQRVVMGQDAALASVDHIKSSVESASKVVQQLLNYVRPTDSKHIPCSLTEIVRSSEPILASFSNSGIEITCKLDDSAGSILADSNKIQQIVLNLCSNAQYAMRETEGKVVITVEPLQSDEQSADPSLPAGDFVALRVSDSGCGIPEDQLDRIHEPYYTTKPVGEGTGLGLWTVLGIAREHRAELRVESKQGEGTTFSIYFPVNGETPVPDRSREAAETWVDDMGTPSLMVVDDEPVIASGLEQLLSLDFDVSVFTQSSEALKEFKEDPFGYDMIITDLAMPGFNGTELISEIRKIRPEIPVILCSGFNDELDTGDPDQRDGSSDTDAFCQKPFRFEELNSAIRRLLKT